MDAPGDRGGAPPAAGGSSDVAREIDAAQQAVAEVASGQPGPSARRGLLVLTLACLLLFAVDATSVASGRYTAFDRSGEVFVQGVPWGPVTGAFAAINWMGGPRQLIFGVMVALAFFVWDRRAGWLILVGSGASLIDNGLKLAFARERPTADLVKVLVHAGGYSFPSGHAVFFTWLAVLVAAAVAPRLRPRARWPLWIGALLLILLTLLGRVYDGAHWPTDVVGGMLLGLGWSAFVLWLPERWLPTPSRTWWRLGRG